MPSSSRAPRRWRTWLIAAVAVGVLLAVGALYAAARSSRAARPKIAAATLERGALTPGCDGGDPVWMSWTGVAGIRLEACRAGAPEPQVLLVDPYLTRHSIPELLFDRVDADERTLARVFPRAHVILVGHSHHDHLGDVPAIARRTGAIVVGTRTTCVLAAAMGVPKEQCREVSGGERLTLGEFEVEVVGHPHGHADLIGVPAPGNVEAIDPGLPGVFDMKMGGALAYTIRVGGRMLYHQGSAGLDDAQLRRLAGLRPDVAFIALALRGNTPSFEDRLIGGLQPRAIVPIHHDDFFGGVLSDGVHREARANIDAFIAASTKAASGTKVLEPAPFERVPIGAALTASDGFGAP